MSMATFRLHPTTCNQHGLVSTWDACKYSYVNFKVGVVLLWLLNGFVSNTPQPNTVNVFKVLLEVRKGVMFCVRCSHVMKPIKASATLLHKQKEAEQLVYSKLLVIAIFIMHLKCAWCWLNGSGGGFGILGSRVQILLSSWINTRWGWLSLPFYWGQQNEYRLDGMIEPLEYPVSEWWPIQDCTQ